jgi:hypothetical protein
MLLENIYSTGVTHDYRHMKIKVFLKHRPQNGTCFFRLLIILEGTTLKVSQFIIQLKSIGNKNVF